MSAVILFLECLHNVDKNKYIFICVFCKRGGLKLVPCAKTWHCLIKYRIMVGMRAFCMLEGVYSNFVDMSPLYCSKSWSFQRTGPRCFKNALLTSSSTTEVLVVFKYKKSAFNLFTMTLSLDVGLLTVRAPKVLNFAEHPAWSLPSMHRWYSKCVEDSDSFKRFDQRSVKLNRLLINTREHSKSTWLCQGCANL